MLGPAAKEKEPSVVEVEDYPDPQVTKLDDGESLACAICLYDIEFDTESKPIDAVRICEEKHFLHKGRCIEGLLKPECPTCRRALLEEWVGRRLLQKFNTAAEAQRVERLEEERRATQAMIEEMLRQEGGHAHFVPLINLSQAMGRIMRGRNQPPAAAQAGVDIPREVAQNILLFALGRALIEHMNGSDEEDDNDEGPPGLTNDSDEDDEGPPPLVDNQEQDGQNFEGSVIWDEAIIEAAQTFGNLLGDDMELNECIELLHSNLRANYPMFSHNDVMTIIHRGMDMHFNNSERIDVD